MDFKKFVQIMAYPVGAVKVKSTFNYEKATFNFNNLSDNIHCQWAK